MKLIWFQRPDGLWNADCACGATCCGVLFTERAEFEVWHFQRADEYRRRGDKHLACGPQFPIDDPNRTAPLVFP